MNEFRCLVTDDQRSRIEAVASGLGARVRYFRGRMGVIAVIKNGEYLGCVWEKDFKQLRKAILEVLNAD